MLKSTKPNQPTKETTKKADMWQALKPTALCSRRRLRGDRLCCCRVRSVLRVLVLQPAAAVPQTGRK